MDAFLTETFLTEAFGGRLVSAMLTDTRQRRDDGLRRVTIRPVLLRGKAVFQFEYQFAQKVQHRNLEAAEAAAVTRALLDGHVSAGTVSHGRRRVFSGQPCRNAHGPSRESDSKSRACRCAARP